MGNTNRELKFETVDNFKYLDIMINNRNEEKHRIQTDNRAYYKYRSKEINRKTKMISLGLLFGQW